MLIVLILYLSIVSKTYFTAPVMGRLNWSIIRTSIVLAPSLETDEKFFSLKSALFIKFIIFAAFSLIVFSARQKQIFNLFHLIYGMLSFVEFYKQRNKEKSFKRIILDLPSLDERTTKPFKALIRAHRTLVVYQVYLYIWFSFFYALIKF